MYYATCCNERGQWTTPAGRCPAVSIRDGRAWSCGLLICAGCGRCQAGHQAVIA